MITYSAMSNQVADAVSGADGQYDQDAIVSQLHAAYGLVDVGSVDFDEFWNLVAANEAK